jgi:hypothetical protein
MAYAGPTVSSENRRVRWLAFDEAVEALDLGKSRRLLRTADRVVPPVTNGKRAWRRGVAARLANWLVRAGLALLPRSSRKRIRKQSARRVSR